MLTSGRTAVERVLLEAARVDGDVRRPLGEVLSAKASPRLLVAAREHGVEPLLRRALRDLDVPAHLRSALDDVHLRNAAFVVKAEHELNRLGDLLFDVPHAIVKGPVAASWYGDPTSRTYSDVDVLIDRRQVNDVLKRLTAGGARLRGSIPAVEVAGHTQLAVDLPRGTALDLHWHLVNDAGARRDLRISTSDLLARRESAWLAAFPVWTLDPVDTVLHLCQHAAVSGGHRLIWYADIDRALRARPVEPALLVERARAWRVAAMTGAALFVVARALGAPGASESAVALQRRAPWIAGARLAEALAPVPREEGRRFRGQLVHRSLRDQPLQMVQAARALRQEHADVQRGVKSVACVSLEEWDDTWRRNQHFASRLVSSGAADRVVFVEPPVLGQGWRRWSPSPGITAVRPPLLLPKRAGGLRLAARALHRDLRRIDVLWINDPQLGVHCLGSGPSVYDVTDDWRAFANPSHIRERIIAAEDQLAVAARTVVCSQVLAHRWLERYDLEPQVVQNAVDVEAVRAATPVALEGTAPHVGYVGTLHDSRLDVALLVQLAASHAGTVHLVGPDALSRSSRASLQNAGVRLHAAVPSRDVPCWTQAFDVLLCPHVVDDFTLSLDAIKAHEYLATDRPIVATPTSGFQGVQAPGLHVVDADSFLPTVAKAIGEAVGARHVDGWDTRTREFARVLGLG